MQKYPKSLADAIKEIKQLRERADDLNNRFEVKSADCQNERHARLTAEKEAKEVRERFADLKERLQASETSVARMQGYMDRVREDDIVRDGVVEVEDHHGKRLVPKRYPEQPDRLDQFNQISAGMDSIMMREQRKHWTSY